MLGYISQIGLFPYTFAPQGWLSCEGQLLEISSNQTLYSLLGNRFGGDGRTTFALPDLRGKAPLPGMAYYIYTSANGIVPSRD
jgi:microcystin-dependent protein